LANEDVVNAIEFGVFAVENGLPLVKFGVIAVKIL